MRMFVFLIGAILGIDSTNNCYSQQLDIQGHRGARGLMPENTIPAFLKALELGATTIEMDVVITADSMVLVSHEAYMSAKICKDSLGQVINPAAEKMHNIYKMTYDQIKNYDCGTLEVLDFPNQDTFKTQKPLLKDVIKSVERYIKSNTLFEVDYNIEIKSSPKGDNLFHPTVEEYSELVFNVIDEYLPWNRVIIQSFDERVLRYWHKKYPEVRLALLVETPGAVSNKINNLGFHPAIYSPYYRLINKQKVNYLHDLNIKVIPWTVNDKDQMKKLLSIGVDGIITDYPDKAAELGLTRTFNKNK